VISERLQWRGEGPKILFLPGWNTPAQFLEHSIPSWFLERWCCGVLEWPGMGRRELELPPVNMNDMLAEIASALDEGPFVGVVGFCLGGVAAWESLRMAPVKCPTLVMVESPYHFPLVLAPLLLPGFGTWIFRGFTQTRLGRFCVERALFHRKKKPPTGFWEAFGKTSASTAQAYLRILSQYERSLPIAPNQPPCNCHRILGGRSPRFLGWPWRRIHEIQAEDHVLENVGHFPAAEAPEALFKLLDLHLTNALP